MRSQLFLFGSARAYGDSDLLYFEAQGIAGYSSLQSKAIYFSMNPQAEMQEPSVGFDYLQRFSGESGGLGVGRTPGASGRGGGG